MKSLLIHEESTNVPLTYLSMIYSILLRTQHPFRKLRWFCSASSNQAVDDLFAWIDPYERPSTQQFLGASVAFNYAICLLSSPSFYFGLSATVASLSPSLNPAFGPRTSFLSSVLLGFLLARKNQERHIEAPTEGLTTGGASRAARAIQCSLPSPRYERRAMPSTLPRVSNCCGYH